MRASIEAGAVAPSTILRKLAAAGPNNALSQALRALGRIERTLFTLQWLSDPALRQRSQAGLNKGEASNALHRAVFSHHQGEFRDRTFENQSFRASGLSLLTAAIVDWNTIYLDQAVQHLRAQGVSVPGELLAHVAPLGWEHIALTGNYDWNTAGPVQGLRPRIAGLAGAGLQQKARPHQLARRVFAAADQRVQALAFLGAQRHHVCLDRNLVRRHQIDPPH